MPVYRLFLTFGLSRWHKGFYWKTQKYPQVTLMRLIWAGKDPCSVEVSIHIGWSSTQRTLLSPHQTGNLPQTDFADLGINRFVLFAALTFTQSIPWRMFGRCVHATVVFAVQKAWWFCILNVHRWLGPGSAALSTHQQLGWKEDGSHSCIIHPSASIHSEHTGNSIFENIQQIRDFRNNRLVVSSYYNNKCSFVDNTRCLSVEA